MTPIGRLTKKTHVQWMCSVMSPPTTGPMAKAAAVVAAQIPIAVARSRSSGKVWLMMARVGGVIIAAPTPCSTRAPMRTAALGASPASSEAMVKTPRPPRKSRRRPNVSARRPPVTSRTAKDST